MLNLISVEERSKIMVKEVHSSRISILKNSERNAKPKILKDFEEMKNLYEKQK